MSQFCNVEFAKMTDIIKHRGIVENINGFHIRVKIVQTSACSACSVKGHCNASESKEKLVDVFDTKASSFLILLAALFITMHLTGGDELKSAIISLLALAPYYFIIYICRGKLSKKFSFTLEPIKNN